MLLSLSSTPSLFLFAEEHNGIAEDLTACHLPARVAELLSAYAKNPPNGSSSETAKQNQLALALCKILSQATEGTDNFPSFFFFFFFFFVDFYISCCRFRCRRKRNDGWG
jgi:hypothetical protein